MKFVRDDVAAYLEAAAAAAGPKLHELSIEDMRQQIRDGVREAGTPAGDLAVYRDFAIPGSAGSIPARLYDARSVRGATPVMLFLHGGGFIIGDLDTNDGFCAEAARQLDIPVISIDYRLAPEHPFPAAPDDCEAAARWVAVSPPELGYTVTGLVISGDSAGGNLAIVTTMALRDRPAAAPVIAQNPIYPIVSEHRDWPSMTPEPGEELLISHEMFDYFDECYRPDPSDARYAPLPHNHRGMPQSIVVTASIDPLQDQGIAYVDALRAAEIDVTHIHAAGTVHGFLTWSAAIPSAKSDIAEILKALDAAIKKSSRPASTS